MCETLICQKPRILLYKIQVRVLSRKNLHTTRQRSRFRKLNGINGAAKRIFFSHPWGIASDSVTCGDFLTWHTRMVEVSFNYLADMPDSLPWIKTIKLHIVIVILINSFTIHLHCTINTVYFILLCLVELCHFFFLIYFLTCGRSFALVAVTNHVNLSDLKLNWSDTSIMPQLIKIVGAVHRPTQYKCIVNYTVKCKGLIWAKKYGQNGWVQSGTVLGANSASLKWVCFSTNFPGVQGQIRPCEGSLWKTLVPLWILKWRPQILALLQTTPQKEANSAPRWAISVVDGSFFLP